MLILYLLQILLYYGIIISMELIICVQKSQIYINRKKFIKHAISKINLYEYETITLNYSFYSELRLSEFEAICIAKALCNKGLISFTNECPDPFYQFILTNKAFSFIPDMNDYLFRFWLPILVSCILSVAAIIISILALLWKI